MSHVFPAPGPRVQILRATLLVAGNLAVFLLYPLTTIGPVGEVLFFAVYGTLFVFGTWWLTRHRGIRLSSAVLGLAVFVGGVGETLSLGRPPALFVHLGAIGYHAVMIVALAAYTFSAPTVLTDVVLAATSLYLVIGSTFASIFLFIEWLAPGSFISITGDTLGWQQMIYYSYVTLTTLGYGDILPVGFYAQAMAALEAVTGVLYTVVLLSRMVGLHARSAP